MRLFAFVVTLAALCAPSPHARGFERQHHAGASVGLSTVHVSGYGVQPGLGVVGHYTYGLNDQFNLLVEGGLSRFGVTTADAGPAPPPRPASIVHGTAGVAYVLDVLRYVPYVGAMGGVACVSGGLARTRCTPDLQLALGLDYQFGRSWAAGIALRQHVLLTAAGDYASYSSALARVEFVWGW